MSNDIIYIVWLILRLEANDLADHGIDTTKCSDLYVGRVPITTTTAARMVEHCEHVRMLEAENEFREIHRFCMLIAGLIEFAARSCQTLPEIKKVRSIWSAGEVQACAIELGDQILFASEKPTLGFDRIEVSHRPGNWLRSIYMESEMDEEYTDPA